MARSLEDELRAALASGNVNGVTIWPDAKGWQANVRWKTVLGWTVEVRKDPAEALLAALKSTTRYEPNPPPKKAAKVDDDFGDLI